MAKENTAEEEEYEIKVTPDEDDDEGQPPKDDSAGSDGDEGSEAEEYSKKVQKRIDTLVRRQREAEEQLQKANSERTTVEEFARRAMEENKTLRSKLESTTDTAYEAFGRSVDSEIAAAKAAYVKAYDEGDGSAMADAQARMAEAAARKGQLSSRPKRKPQEEQSQQPQQQQPWQQQPQQQRQPVKVSETTRDWAARNTWFQAPGKERMTNMAMSLHAEAVQNGFDVESEDYFAYIDENMRKMFPDEVAAQASSKASQPRVAGAQRSGGKKRVDTITESEAQLCKRMGITEKEYLEQKRKLS